MKANALRAISESWSGFKAATGFGHISNESEYDAAVALLDRLADGGAMDASHSLNDLFLLVADGVERFESRRYPLPRTGGAETLRFLMRQHDLAQKDIAPMLGSQSVVSEVLNGKRELNRGQIEKLASYFSISPAAFFSARVPRSPGV